MRVGRAARRTKARPRKDVQFNIRMAFENKERIERAAKVTKQSLTEFAEAAVLERAEQVLDRHERILLSDRDFDAFVRMMNAGAKPSKTALREAAEFSQGRMEGARYHW